MTCQPRITTKDNHYFEVWTRPCGHSVRVRTEDTQWVRSKVRGERARLTRLTRDRLAANPCRQCAEAAEPSTACA